MTSTAHTPGLCAVVALLAFAICLASFAIRQINIGVAAAIVILLATGVALGSLTAEARRERQAHRDSSRAGRRALARR